MKILKIIKSSRPKMEENVIKDFLYKNLPTEMITGIEYDYPRTILRVLKLLGIEEKEVEQSLLEPIYESVEENKAQAV